MRAERFGVGVPDASRCVLTDGGDFRIYLCVGAHDLELIVLGDLGLCCGGPPRSGVVARRADRVAPAAAAAGEAVLH